MPKVKAGDTVRYVDQGYKVIGSTRVEDDKVAHVDAPVLEVLEDGSFIVETDNPAVTVQFNDKGYSKEGKVVGTWYVLKEATDEKAAKATTKEVPQESPAQ